MKEADKRARIALAYGGLLRLQEYCKVNKDHKETRLHLLALDGRDKRNDSPEVIKARRSKEWQKDYVNRLVDAGILIRVHENSQDLYYPADLEVIPKILKDHDEYGLRLSKFLFPNEAGIPPELQEDEGEEKLEEENDETEEGEVVEAQLADVMEQMAKHIKAIASNLNVMREAYNLQSDTLLSAIRKLDDLSLMNAPSQSEKEFPSYVKNRFKEIDEKLDRMTERLNRTSDGVTTAGVLLSKVDAGLQALHKMTPEWFQWLAGLIGLQPQETMSTLLDKKLTFYLGKLTGDQALKDVLAELRTKLRDLSSIEDLALKAIEAAEGKEGQDGG